MSADPVRLEVWHHLLAAVCEEAGARLQRAAISPNIRERRDYSFALFDRDGRLVAQAAHIPVHLGSARDAVAAVRARDDAEPGDVYLLNDPFAGGTHLPDLTLVRPAFLGAGPAPDWFLVSRAHHADVGGASPGSMGIAHDLIAEGLVLPPVKLQRRGEPARDLQAVLLANMRGATERRIDLQAQQSSLLLAERRLAALAGVHGDELATYAAHLLDASERIARSVVREIPRGTWRAEDCLEDDGTGSGPLPIRLALRRRGDQLEFDFRDCASQARGSVNANRSILLAACVYVLRCLCPDRLPTNDGLFRVFDVRTRPGTIVDPHPPAPVAGGNVETSQRLVDVAFTALARALPGRIPACSAGTMSNFAVGGTDPRSGREFAFYETLPGGAGAGAAPGQSAIQTHMTNTRNTPIEELERQYPLRVQQWTVRRGSGGRGARRGGDGVVKEIEFIGPAVVTLLAERHAIGPPGRERGGAGAPGRLQHGHGKRLQRRAAKGTFVVAPGDRVRIETPGGGGCGKA